MTAMVKYYNVESDQQKKKLRLVEAELYTRLRNKSSAMIQLKVYGIIYVYESLFKLLETLFSLKKYILQYLKFKL